MEVQGFRHELARVRVVGVLRAPSAQAAVEAALAAVRGGLRAIELTFTTPGALEALHDLREQLPKGVLLGVGTVTNAAQGRAALEAGAQFLVSPHLGEELLELAREARVPYVPGVLTPTEIARARSLGAEVIKVFPAGSSGGIPYLKDLLGPFPDLQILATGGIKPGEVPAYLQAGVLAVGLGSNLFPRAALEGGDWEGVEVATRRALEEAGVA
ncbi:MULTISPECIES: bifunctional 4-hydroxy-2-oxoglutarate aldolase/2-dehydro-3-deoxy-phosphogluconate aldolase [unclassified Meiothermus]|uniref:bifunctional 4-hydroxy-2-oxoglutarate aldolase/2-dehydro-3-deoxy-phosphogluconate aldolase n=1 Tax=unclassified Meiothermus TaxID=370471 RepID=UPI000D7CDEDE|nr:MULTISPECIES: bifunctional 4-hydroxy-2-oxoglutarate aldolase/2-dehydro-3-deoxy-phosphogluconate aldolase [unclassified Meiothermus]PZA05928.1 2-dehydro-3-deoxyphosphogluconate aldolase [Meiothermus sp. Pnk-1]RYM36468.1 bifunctional 4-hydroxy-2-oxoglutarate aldolase/2-dehydro-3-deoxy-phosphogluconate aldolase [Meiothermus sp. PNK-Is4]